VDYYSLRYLTNQYRRRIVGSRLLKASTTIPRVLLLSFEKEASGQQLLVDTTPGNVQCFFNNRMQDNSRHRYLFFEELEGATVTNFQIAELDRILFLEFDDAGFLQMELFGPRANVSWFNNQGHLVESFRKKFTSEPKKIKNQELSIPRTNCRRLSPRIPRVERTIKLK
jgi:predicted ribosome quality control (RQC) complex YloA/Tae2 family protein